jgi:hypothetical protein
MTKAAHRRKKYTKKAKSVQLLQYSILELQLLVWFIIFDGFSSTFYREQSEQCCLY